MELLTKILRKLLLAKENELVKKDENDDASVHVNLGKREGVDELLMLLVATIDQVNDDAGCNNGNKVKGGGSRLVLSSSSYLN